MAGRDASKNLTGMFYQMNQGLAGEGKAGMQFVDTLRRSFAPEVDPNSSDSLMNYANYASRNGYKDEFDRYSRMSVMQGQVEQQEAQKAKLSEGQLSIANSLSAARNIAVDTSLPTAERTEKIRQIEQEARDVAAISGVNPLTINEPISQLLNHISKTETAGQATTIAAEAAKLRTGIAESIARGEIGQTEALIAEYQPLIERAQAHGSVDLIDTVTNGLTGLIDKIPDAQERSDEKAALRAVELTEGGGSVNEIDALLTSPSIRKLYSTELSKREADQLALEQAEQDGIEQQLRIDKDRADAEERALEGAELTFQRGGGLEYLAGSPMERQYIEQYAAAPTNARRKEINKKFIQLNGEVQANRQEGLKADALIYANRIAQMLGDTETGDFNPLNKSLGNWTDSLQLGTPQQSASWDKHATAIAELLHKDPRFYGGNEKERVEVAKEYTVNHMRRADKYFAQAYKNNEEARVASEKARGIRAEEEATDWAPTKDGKDTNPASNAKYVDQQYKEWSARTLKNGQRGLSKKDWLEQVWKRWFYLPDRNQRRDTGVRGNKVETDVATRLFPNRRSGMQAERQPVRSDNGPSLLTRQRNNLSPPIGPMGDPEDYETKLRQARRDLPFEYPQPDLGESADPYIDPRYRNLGGN